MAKTMQRANVPAGAQALGEKLTKIDLLELAWDFAALSNEVGADDIPATLDRLVAMVNERRAMRHAKPLAVSLATATDE